MSEPPSHEVEHPEHHDGDQPPEEPILPPPPPAETLDTHPLPPDNPPISDQHSTQTIPPVVSDSQQPQSPAQTPPVVDSQQPSPADPIPPPPQEESSNESMFPDHSQSTNESQHPTDEEEETKASSPSGDPPGENAPEPHPQPVQGATRSETELLLIQDQLLKVAKISADCIHTDVAGSDIHISKVDRLKERKVTSVSDQPSVQPAPPGGFPTAGAAVSGSGSGSDSGSKLTENCLPRRQSTEDGTGGSQLCEVGTPAVEHVGASLKESLPTPQDAVHQVKFIEGQKPKDYLAKKSVTSDTTKISSRTPAITKSPTKIEAKEQIAKQIAAQPAPKQIPTKLTAPKSIKTSSKLTKMTTSTKVSKKQNITKNTKLGSKKVTKTSPQLTKTSKLKASGKSISTPANKISKQKTVWVRTFDGSKVDMAKGKCSLKDPKQKSTAKLLAKNVVKQRAGSIVGAVPKVAAAGKQTGKDAKKPPKLLKTTKIMKSRVSHVEKTKSKSSKK